MSVDLSQFIPTFLEESFEGLELMESSLLNLEQGDDETINSIFRAAHSIKGGAGTFGFGHVTDFTHLVETLLDEMRDGRREIRSDDVELLLESVDCIRLMIEAIQNETDYDPSKITATSEKLSILLDGDDSASSTTNAEEVGEVSSSDEPNTKTVWQIKFIPEHHLVQTGNDPLLLFSALEDFGELEVHAVTDNLPALTEIDVEELYISWQLTLTSETATEEDIKEVFEWVEDECELIITEHSVNIESSTTSEAAPSDDNVASVSDTNEQTDANVTPIDSAVAMQPPEAASSQSQAEKPKAKEAKVAAKAKTDSGSIRVGVDKVDSLINLVGELVITQSMLSELGNDFDLSKVEKLTAGLEQLLQNTKELQESVMRIRMLPISFAFNRFPRLIHDLARKTGKDIELIINGENTELDKTVMEQIGDPLVHLVRNAVDHGIESAEKRLAAGKNEQGTIWLDALPPRWQHCYRN